jgi:hypothetical protein
MLTLADAIGAVLTSIACSQTKQHLYSIDAVARRIALFDGILYYANRTTPSSLEPDIIVAWNTKVCVWCVRVQQDLNVRSLIASYVRFHTTTAAEGDAHLQGASEVDHFSLHRRQGPLQFGYRPHLQVRWCISTDRRHDADRFCRCWNVVRWNKQGFTTAMPHLAQRSAQDLALDTEERVRLVGMLSHNNRQCHDHLRYRVSQVEAALQLWEQLFHKGKAGVESAGTSATLREEASNGISIPEVRAKLFVLSAHRVEGLAP